MASCKAVKPQLSPLHEHHRWGIGILGIHLHFDRNPSNPTTFLDSAFLVTTGSQQNFQSSSQPSIVWKICLGSLFMITFSEYGQ